MLTDDLRPILLDFGLATSDEDLAGNTESILGTPAYMSPERQARKDAHRMDGRSDIYSLGVILYQMLCGRRPFNAPDVYELMRQVREDEPQPPRQRNPGIPRELERICLKAMSKRIDDRYTTAGDLAAELRVALNPPAPVPGGMLAGARPVEPAGESTLSLGTCPACLRSNPADAAFCAGCGAALTPVKADPSERPTAATGRGPAAEKDPAKFETSRLSAGPTTRPGLTTSSPPSSHPPSSSRPAVREAERRQVTIFYCNHNLGETVELFEVLEPGDRDLLLGRWAKLCEEEVDRYQGTIAELVGPRADGLLRLPPGLRGRGPPRRPGRAEDPQGVGPALRRVPPAQGGGPGDLGRRPHRRGRRRRRRPRRGARR